MPVRPNSDLPIALSLAGVVERAQDRSDRSSLLATLDSLIRWKITSLEDRKLRRAGQYLFGIESNSSGENLSTRRELASAASSYEVHHFRKRIEPQILLQLTTALIKDSEVYGNDRAKAPQLVAVSNRPKKLPTDVLAWEAIEHEENVLMLWSAIYGLKAKLFKVERLLSMETETRLVRRAAEDALWCYGKLIQRNQRYRVTYGNRLLSEEHKFGMESFPRLAGWTPAIEPSQAPVLLEAATTETKKEFLNSLLRTKRGRELMAEWCEALLYKSGSLPNSEKRGGAIDAALRK